jgi:flavorubredoxin
VKVAGGAVEARFFVERVTSNLYLLRVDDTRVEYFEAAWEIPEKITYNAYLLVGGEAVLFDGWKREYSDAFVSALEKVVDPRDLKYAVVHHAEPDHSGTAPVVAGRSQAVFLGHPVAGRVLRSHFGVERFKPVRDGEQLRVGDFTLRFVHTPWLHWPDTMVTFVEEEGVLLTCDVFGSYSLPPLFDDQADLGRLSRYVRKYAVTVIGHYIDWVPKGIAKLESLGLKPRIIAPGHGTVYRGNPRWVVEEYLKVASGQPDPGKAVLLYVSMYGNVEKAFERAAAALESKGMRVVRHAFTDKERAPLSEVLADISDAELLVVGAPTYEAGAHPLAYHVLRAIGEKLPQKRGMPVVVLSSYGWGAAGKKLVELLNSYGFTRVQLVEFEGAAPPELEGRLEEGLRALGCAPGA